MMTLLHNIPFADYLAWPEISQSSLKEGRKSMLHLYQMWQQGIGKTPTPDMLLGSALHCAFLEPELMPEKVVVYKKKRDPRAKEWQAFQQEHAGKIILTEVQYVSLQGMMKSLRQHPFVREWAGRTEDVEVSGKGEWCGMQVKARCDALTFDPLVDLKKVADGDIRLFGNNVERYGYHIQAAIYRKVFGRDRFVLLTVEGTPPYDVVPYELDSEALRAGEQEAIRLLQGAKRCLDTGRWPGRSDEIVELALPEWALPDDDPVTIGGKPAFTE